jgi:protein-S-isoprenylcysteine O-methyltransferase Ste14
MNHSTVLLSLDLPWITFLTYWIIKASKTRETQRKESFASRYLVMFLMIAGYVFIFSFKARIGVLGGRFVPDTPSVVIFGIVMTWLGVGLAVWARYHLAENWSSRVTIKQGHELIRTGPYARLRHPIYSGLLLATLGSAVAIGEWRCVVGVCLVLAAYCIKAKREETMLTGQFGEAFQDHRKHTGFLLPKLR